VPARRSDRRRIRSALARQHAPQLHRGRDSDILFGADRSPDKQGCFLPGSRIPIVGPDHVAAVRPDYLLILTWDLRDEIVHQMGHIREWGGRFVVPLPELSVLP
jgi:hypothetical protein